MQARPKGEIVGSTPAEAAKFLEHGRLKAGAGGSIPSEVEFRINRNWILISSDQRGLIHW